jgi:hypothetical protein
VHIPNRIVQSRHAVRCENAPTRWRKIDTENAGYPEPKTMPGVTPITGFILLR